MSWSGSVRCGYCYKTGHNKRSCEVLKSRMEERLKNDPTDYYAKEYFENKKNLTKTCSYCKTPGHTRPTCQTIKDDHDLLIELLSKNRTILFEKLVQDGLSVGTLVNVPRNTWSNLNPEPALVTGVHWGSMDNKKDFSVSLTYLSDGSKSFRTYDLEEKVSAYSYFEILSPIPKQAVCNSIPKNWKNGILYVEETYFPKSERRRGWVFDELDSPLRD